MLHAEQVTEPPVAPTGFSVTCEVLPERFDRFLVLDNLDRFMLGAGELWAEWG